jgi:hypothetical protein
MKYYLPRKSFSCNVNVNWAYGLIKATDSTDGSYAETRVDLAGGIDQTDIALNSLAFRKSKYKCISETLVHETAHVMLYKLSEWVDLIPNYSKHSFETAYPFSSMRNKRIQWIRMLHPELSDISDTMVDEWGVDRLLESCEWCK